MSAVDTAPARLPAGKAPVGTGTAPLIAQLLGLVLVGLGVLGVQAAVSTVQGGTSCRTTMEQSLGTRLRAFLDPGFSPGRPPWTRESSSLRSPMALLARHPISARSNSANPFRITGRVPLRSKLDSFFFCPPCRV